MNQSVQNEYTSYKQEYAHPINLKYGRHIPVPPNYYIQSSATATTGLSQASKIQSGQVSTGQSSLQAFQKPPSGGTCFDHQKMINQKYVNTFEWQGQVPNQFSFSQNSSADVQKLRSTSVPEAKKFQIITRYKDGQFRNNHVNITQAQLSPPQFSNQQSRLAAIQQNSQKYLKDFQSFNHNQQFTGFGNPTRFQKQLILNKKNQSGAQELSQNHFDQSFDQNLNRRSVTPNIIQNSTQVDLVSNSKKYQLVPQNPDQQYSNCLQTPSEMANNQLMEPKLQINQNFELAESSQLQQLGHCPDRSSMPRSTQQLSNNERLGGEKEIVEHKGEGCNQVQNGQFLSCQVSYNEVYVWGNNKSGQLGLGSAELQEDNTQNQCIDYHGEQAEEDILPKVCCFNTVVVKVCCGTDHSLLLSHSGHVYSMGSNQYGQLGTGESCFDTEGLNGKRQPVIRALPCLVEGLKDLHIKDLATGNYHCLALNDEGDQLFSWGMGKFGALGNGQHYNQKVPQRIQLPIDQKTGKTIILQSIAAGARHSAFISQGSFQLYTFGQACHGQLGLGPHKNDKVYSPQIVNINSNSQQIQKICLNVCQVAAGDMHTIILLSNGRLMCTGSNEKYQLGINPDQRSLKLFEFHIIDNFKKYETQKVNGATHLRFKTIYCWNLNAAVDEDDHVYFWGLLFDKKVKKSLCIKVPEIINDFRVSSVAIGPTMAMLVEKQSQKSYVIGINANGELGLGDRKQRKTLECLTDLKDKQVSSAAIGKSGFILAFSSVIINPGTQQPSLTKHNKCLQQEQLSPSQSLRQSQNNSKQLSVKEQNQTSIKTTLNGLQQNQSNVIDDAEEGAGNRDKDVQVASNLGKHQMSSDSQVNTIDDMKTRIKQLEKEVFLKDNAISQNNIISQMLLDQLQKFNNNLHLIDQKQMFDEFERLYQMLEIHKQRSNENNDYKQLKSYKNQSIQHNDDVDAAEEMTNSQEDTGELQQKEPSEKGFDGQELKTIDKTQVSNSQSNYMQNSIYHSQPHSNQLEENENILQMSVMKEERASQITQDNLIHRSSQYFGSNDQLSLASNKEQVIEIPDNPQNIETTQFKESKDIRSNSLQNQQKSYQQQICNFEPDTLLDNRFQSMDFQGCMDLEEQYQLRITGQTNLNETNFQRDQKKTAAFQSLAKKSSSDLNKNSQLEYDDRHLSMAQPQLQDLGEVSVQQKIKSLCNTSEKSNQLDTQIQREEWKIESIDNTDINDLSGIEHRNSIQSIKNQQIQAGVQTNQAILIQQNSSNELIDRLIDLKDQSTQNNIKQDTLNQNTQNITNNTLVFLEKQKSQLSSNPYTETQLDYQNPFADIRALDDDQSNLKDEQKRTSETNHLQYKQCHGENLQSQPFDHQLENQSVTNTDHLQLGLGERTQEVIPAQLQLLKNLQQQIVQRETDQIQLQDQILNLQKRLDSLVKLLEQERQDKKQIQIQCKRNDEAVEALKHQVGLQENALIAKGKEIEQQIIDKEFYIQENQQLKKKLYEMEKKVRVAEAVQNHDKLFLNYNNLNQKLELSSKQSDFTSNVFSEEQKLRKQTYQNSVPRNQVKYTSNNNYISQNNLTNFSKYYHHRGRSGDPLLSSVQSSNAVSKNQEAKAWII